MRKRLVGFLLCFVLSLQMAALSSAESAPTSESQVKVTFENGTELHVDQVDQTRPADGVSLFTAAYGSFSPSFDANTTEIIVSDSTVMAVNKKGQHGTYIPKNGFVLSVSGSANATIPEVVLGDSVQLSGMALPVIPSRYVQLGDVIVPVDQLNVSRGEGSVVVYQPSFGATTNTNLWGMEITVSGNQVTKVVALEGNSAIPADGYVLSVQISSEYYGKLLDSVPVGTPAKLNINEVPLYDAAKTTYNAFNPKVKEDNPAGWDDANNQPYPGFRGADQLIIYDDSYGQSTGTNPWGYEVTVDKNSKVVSLAGNNSAIPAGGMVLSGHGVQADWLQKYARVGATVILKPATKQLLLVFTPDSYLERADVQITAAEQGLQTSRSQFLDVPYSAIEQKIADARAKLAQLKNQMDLGDFSQIFQLSADIDGIANEAYFMNFESRKAEHRGIWVRPLETTAEEVRQHVAQIAEANLNTIYLEAWWDGYTIFPTDNPLTSLNPRYQGFDVLKAYLDEAAKYNIDVHAWVENFFVDKHLLDKKPEWSIRNREGDNFETVNGAKWYWLNPAHPEARDFVSSVYKEMITKYDIQGLHLDYTRYPESGDYTNDYGYDTYTRGLFQDKYGVDPITVHRGDPLWDEWVDFRVQIINTWVYRVVGEAKQIKPNIKISAAVMDNFAIAPEFKLQDAKDWVRKNYIDHISPMTYTFDVDSVVKSVTDAQAFSKDKAYVVVGLGPYLRTEKKIVAGQVQAQEQIGGGGTGMFEFIGYFANRYDREMNLGLYRNKAIVPDKDPEQSIRLLLEDMTRKINDIYIPNGGMNDKAKYVKELDKLSKETGKASKDGYDSHKASKLHDDIAQLMAEISKDTALHAEVQKRLVHDLQYIQQILDIHRSKMDGSSGIG